MWDRNSVAARASKVMEESFDSGIEVANGDGRVGCRDEDWMVSVRRGLVG